MFQSEYRHPISAVSLVFIMILLSLLVFEEIDTGSERGRRGDLIGSNTTSERESSPILHTEEEFTG